MSLVSTGSLRHRRGDAVDAVGIHEPQVEREKPQVLRNNVSCSRTIAKLLFGGVLLYMIFVAAVLYFRDDLPRPLALDAPKDVFSENRAFEDLVRLTGDIGIGRRLVGTKWNEEQTVNFLLQRIKAIQNEKCSNPLGCASLLVQAQNATGSFPFFFIDRFIHNSYTNITNIAVRVKGHDDGAANRALLINTHFDSAISAPGASDAGTIFLASAAGSDSIRCMCGCYA